MHKRDIPLTLKVDWKDLYDFLFGEFHLKQFSAIANKAAEQADYNVKNRVIAHA